MEFHCTQPSLFAIDCDKGFDRTKKEASIFVKIESKHFQVISCKFPKSFRGAGDW